MTNSGTSSGRNAGLRAGGMPACQSHSVHMRRRVPFHSFHSGAAAVLLSAACMSLLWWRAHTGNWSIIGCSRVSRRSTVSDSTVTSIMVWELSISSYATKRLPSRTLVCADQSRRKA